MNSSTASKVSNFFIYVGVLIMFVGLMSILLFWIPGHYSTGKIIQPVSPPVVEMKIGEYQGRYTVGYRQGPSEEFHVVKLSSGFEHFRVDQFSIDLQLKKGMLVTVVDGHIIRMVPVDDKLESSKNN